MHAHLHLTQHARNAAQDTVSCLAAGEGGMFVSGSWDKTVRVWKNKTCTHTLRGHTLAVWGVCILSNGDIVSGAADKLIKVRMGCAVVLC